MAAGVARDLVAFRGGKVDFAEPLHDLLLRLREADIGFSSSHARRLIFVARLARQKEDAGEEIGEARAGPRRKRAAAPPLRDVMRAVEGDDDELRLLRLWRCGLLDRWGGRSDDRQGCTGGKDDAAGYGHGHPGFGSQMKRLCSNCGGGGVGIRARDGAERSLHSPLEGEGYYCQDGSPSQICLAKLLVAQRWTMGEMMSAATAKFWAIRSKSTEVENPISTERLASLSDFAEPVSDMAVLDVDCGKAWLLRQWAKTYGIRGTGLELNPHYVEAARDLTREMGIADRITYVEGPALDFDFASGSFDIVMCLGDDIVIIAVTDQPLDAVFRREAAGQFFAMFPDPALKVACQPDIQCDVLRRREYVDVA